MKDEFVQSNLITRKILQLVERHGWDRFKYQKPIKLSSGEVYYPAVTCDLIHNWLRLKFKVGYYVYGDGCTGSLKCVAGICINGTNNTGVVTGSSYEETEIKILEYLLEKI